MIDKKRFLDEQSAFYDRHVKTHSANAFCGTAGPEEMRHVEELVAALTDDELAQLVKAGGISFGKKVDRDDYENVVNEIDREDFYREYRRLKKGTRAA